MLNTYMDFRSPALWDKKGNYVTNAQLRFFLNSSHNRKKIRTLHPDFKEFLSFCKFYNFLWDKMEEDPSSADMYWDEESESIAFSFPKRGEVADYLLYTDDL